MTEQTDIGKNGAPTEEKSEKTEEIPTWDWSKARMSDEDLKEFVLDYCDRRIFTDQHITSGRVRDVGMVFMVLGLGAGAGMRKEDIDQVGLIWEHMSKAGPRAINGMPTFLSARLMHKDDWERARKAIKRELDRRKEIEV